MSAAAASPPVAVQRATALSTRARSGPKSSARARKNAPFSSSPSASVAAENLARQRHARGFAASAEQRAAHLGERGGPVFGVARPGAELEHGAPALGDRGEKIGEKGVSMPRLPAPDKYPVHASRGPDRPNCRRRRGRIKSAWEAAVSKWVSERARPDFAQPMGPGEIDRERHDRDQRRRADGHQRDRREPRRAVRRK